MQDSLGRLCRAAPSRQEGWFGLVLHLSRLPPPAPRAYHRRIARALLDDAAARRAGQVFGLGTGDLVLLLHGPDLGAELAVTIARLFQVDVPDPSVLLTLWRLPEDRDAAHAYAAALAAGGPARPGVPHEPANSLDAVDAAERLVRQTPAARLLYRQTAVLLTGVGGMRLRPLFRHIGLSLAPIEAALPPLRHALSDPYLLRHLHDRLGTRILDDVADDRSRDGPLTAGDPPRLHVGLSLSTILSDGFAAAMAACGPVPLGATIQLHEACTAPEAFQRARARLHGAGWHVVLAGVTHHALALVRPAALQPDLVKLEWSERLAGADHVAPALAPLGPGRVVLDRADAEAAVQWGLAHGIRRFQGRHVEAMLAAERIAACPASRPCSVRGCAACAGSADAGQRSGCGNHPLLDAA